MSVSVIVNVAIILAAFFVSLSCICSWVNEQIAALLRLRGMQLYGGVLNLLAGDESLVKSIFTHPLIASAANTKNGTINADGGRRIVTLIDVFKRNTYRPSYIAPANFANALWQTVKAVKDIPNGTQIADALSTPDVLFHDLAARVSILPDGGLKKALTAILAEASGSYDGLLTATEAWFNAQMDHVAGWYRRQTQYIVIAIAVFIVLISGLDSFDIARRAAAMDPSYLNAVAQSIGTAAKASGQATPAPGQAILTALCPGIQGSASSSAALCVDPIVPHPIWTGWSGASVLGLLATMLALSLGGPFWFDLLKTIVNVRLAGNAPQTKEA